MYFDLWHGDCLRLLPYLPDASIDLVLADPPYGTTACKWDTVIPLDRMWNELTRVIKPRGAIVLFGSQPFTSVLVTSNLAWFKYELISNKGRGFQPQLANVQPMKSHDNICVFGNGRLTYNPQKTPLDKPDIRKTNTVNGGEHGLIKNYGKIHDRQYNDRYPTSIIDAGYERGYHPTQKPVKLLEWLIKTYSNPGEVVLDFCMGSGSTGVACINTGRAFKGIELDKTYYDVSCTRIREAIYTSNTNPLIKRG